MNPDDPLVPERGRTAPRGRSLAALVIAVLLASFVIGGLESFAQQFLPAALSPLANSASGWTIVTALLVFFSRVRTGWAAVLGGVSMVLLVCGYALVSTWRGYYYDPLMWSLIGAVVGPFVGVAAAWLHESRWRAALGTGLLTGIGFGEAVYGVVAISATTGLTYWIVVAALAATLLVVMLVRRIRGILPILVTLAVAVAVALAFLLTFAGFGGGTF